MFESVDSLGTKYHRIAHDSSQYPSIIKCHCESVSATDSPVSRFQAPLKLMNSKTSMAAGLAYHSHRVAEGKLCSGMKKRARQERKNIPAETPDSNERNTSPQNASCWLIQ